VSTLVERPVGSRRKRGLQAPGQSRDKNGPGRLAGRRPSPPYSRWNEGSLHSIGIAIITRMHRRFSLPHDLTCNERDGRPVASRVDHDGAKKFRVSYPVEYDKALPFFIA
jgi:hypothetical protein